MTSWPNPQINTGVEGSDKIAHFAVYAILGALVARALALPRSWGLLALALGGLLVFGAVDEWHQQFIPGRSMSLADWVADSLGAAAGLLFGHHLLSLARARQDLST